MKLGEYAGQNRPALIGRGGKHGLVDHSAERLNVQMKAIAARNGAGRWNIGEVAGLDTLDVGLKARAL